MMRLASPRAVVVGSAAVVAVNAALLLLSAGNRSGEPDARLRLTERELRLPAARERENSSLTLTLAISPDAPPEIRRAAQWRGRLLPAFDLPWLDGAKLRELGFRASDGPSGPDRARDHGSWAIERRAFVVVELEGQAWQSWIASREAELATLRDGVARGATSPQDLEETEALVAFDRTARSRLVPIDAGLDRRELRRRHPDSTRCAIVPAVVIPPWPRGDRAAPAVLGRVRLVPEFRVSVPSSLRGVVEPLVPEGSLEDLLERERSLARQGWPEPAPPRYAVVLAIGRRGAPWIVEASLVGLPPVAGQ